MENTFFPTPKRSPCTQRRSTFFNMPVFRLKKKKIYKNNNDDDANDDDDDERRRSEGV